MEIGWTKPFGRTHSQSFYQYFRLNGINSSQTSFLHAKIGSIRQKNDGRWEYTLESKSTKRWGEGSFNPTIVSDKVVQGVCYTYQEAKQKVEDNFVDCE